eukprot:9300786-Pyramimonas_sp.AAC.1
MGAEPGEQMSEHIRFAPVRIAASSVTHCQRDRLYWIDERLHCDWQGEVRIADNVKEVVIPGGPGPVSRWLSSYLKWHGDVDHDFRLPTFLRCVPR